MFHVNICSLIYITTKHDALTQTVSVTKNQIKNKYITINDSPPKPAPSTPKRHIRFHRMPSKGLYTILLLQHQFPTQWLTNNFKQSHNQKTEKYCILKIKSINFVGSL